MKFMKSYSLISGSQYKTFSCLNIWKTVYSKRIVCFKTISRFLTRRKTKNPCIYLRKILYKNKSYVHSDSKYLQKWKYWRLLCREYFVFLHIFKQKLGNFWEEGKTVSVPVLQMRASLLAWKTLHNHNPKKIICITGMRFTKLYHQVSHLINFLVQKCHLNAKIVYEVVQYGVVWMVSTITCN